MDSQDVKELTKLQVFIDHALGVLPHAIQIGNTVRLIAWAGLVLTLVWFSYRYYRQQNP